MADNAHRLIPVDFPLLPGLTSTTKVSPVARPSTGVQAVGHPVGPGGALPEGFPLEWPALREHGFEGRAAQSFSVPRAGEPDLILIGLGAEPADTEAGLRDAVATLVRAAGRRSRIAIDPRGVFSLPAGDVGSAAAEAAVLARYRYTPLQTKPSHTPLTDLEVVTDDAHEQLEEGVRRGQVLARATVIARDLANTPPNHLTATVFADLAADIGPGYGLDVEIADRAALIELGCGGLLGVNAGSIEEPRMITLRYTPASRASSAPSLAFVGKGIMYDSGGISLKPSDPMHLLMKMDMGGAAAVFGAMTTLRDLGCAAQVTAFLMCTDNMISASATVLGDVLTIRNGTTVEVKNTDAEGRLVMSDALALAAELRPDAIVDIATLTGAALMALGPATAAAFGNDQPLVDRVLAAACATDEPAWQLPLEKKYRSQLDSDIADIANLGGKFAGSTTAALFLAEFVGDIPWAHLDIAGTMQSDTDDSWRSKGATGFGARLLARFAVDYATP